MTPSTLIAGQSECAGCGSDAMSCGVPPVWLLTNVTLSPGLIVTCVGETAPLAPMVIVAPLGPGLPPPGPGLLGLLEPPPHATADARAQATSACRTTELSITMG